MKVLFYSKTAKLSLSPESQWVKVFLDEDDEDAEFEMGYNSFQETNLVCGRAPIFASDIYENVNATLESTILDEVEPLVQKYQSDVVLVCTVEFFKDALNATEQDEMEAQMLSTVERGLLYYAPIGEDKCALLVAYDPN